MRDGIQRVVNFGDWSNARGPAILSSGTATLVVPALAATSHQFAASYAGGVHMQRPCPPVRRGRVAEVAARSVCSSLD